MVNTHNVCLFMFILHDYIGFKKGFKGAVMSVS